VLGQTVDEGGVITIGNNGVTDTVMLAVPVHPAPLSPITEKVVLLVGVTAITAVLAPVLHV
jgi:hypothetical protein